MGRNGRRLQSFQQFDVADDQCGMKVGTDALVLGCWAGENLQGVTRILDIGTGSGILALMLAQRHERYATILATGGAAGRPAPSSANPVR